MRRAAWIGIAAAPVATAAVACSAILGIEPPPAPPDGGPGTGGDGATTAPTCAPLDAGLGPDATVEAGTYAPLAPVTLGGPGSAWDWFDANQIGGSTSPFYGGTFDGRYVYFAGRGVGVVRYDTEAGSFDSPSAWSVFAVNKAPLSAPGGFSGAVFDGRHVYFVPYVNGSTYESVVVRYDTQSAAGFTSPASWASFDLVEVAGLDGGAGFFGGTFDGRYLYLAPRYDGAATGRVLRYDTEADGGLHDAGPADAAGDAGDGGDAGDAGDAGSTASSAFSDPASWSAFDVATVDPQAVGFAGAVFDGTSLYLVPQANFAFGGAVHSGLSSTVARLDVKSGLTKASSWSTFDLTNVNGLAYGFTGAAFDGHYVYLVPHTQGIALRFDPTGKASIKSAAAWSSYDLTRVVRSDASPASYAGAAFDGRFVYFLPSSQPSPPGVPFTTLVRYDTLSPFSADCAWSTVDFASVTVPGVDGGRPPGSLGGAVFDGQYLYLAPLTTGIFGRFQARTPASFPALPAFHGSFW